MPSNQSFPISPAIEAGRDYTLHSVGGIGGSLPKNRDNVRKHCAVLVKAGLILGQPDPQHGKRLVYQLAPAVKAETTPAGRTLDFGCCVLRC